MVSPPPFRPSWRRSFRVRLAALLVLLAVAPVSLVGWVVIDVNQRVLEDKSRDVRLAALDDVAGAVDAEVSAAVDALDATGRALTRADLSDDARLAAAMVQVEGSSAIDHAAIYGADGRLLDTIREQGSRAPPAPDLLSADAREGAAARGQAIGEAVAAGDGVRALVVVPLRAGGRITGHAASQMTLDGVQARLRRLAELRFAGGGALYLVDQRGRLLGHGDPEQPELTPTTGRGIFAAVDPAALRAGVVISAEYRDGGDERTIGSAIPLDSGWVVVAEMPRSAVYGSLTRVRRIVILVAAAAALLAAAAALLASRRMARPLRRLADLAGALGERRFDARASVSTGDEIGVLAAAMNGAAAELERSEARLREEAAIRADLGRFLPAEVVDRIVAREQDMALGGARRDITVVFADVAGSARLAQTLTPEQLVRLLNELFTIMTEIVFRHGGMVDKFIGDAIMAIWGAPEAQPDHASRAVTAAEEMLRWLEIGNARWHKEYGVTIELAIGIHTGEAVVGNVGSQTRMDYTAIGDAVNLAARLETLARPRQILVSRATRDAAGEGFDFMPIGPRALAGRSEPVELFELSV